jgi:hypothetical protein
MIPCDGKDPPRIVRLGPCPRFPKIHHTGMVMMSSPLHRASSELLVATCLFLCLSACSGERGNGADDVPGNEGVVEVVLTSRGPDAESGKGLRWSPKGQQLPLSEVEGGMLAHLNLGPEGTPPIGLLLAKGPGAVYFDCLFIDINRDGEFDETELHETEVSETRDKFWSSFEATVGIPVVDPKTGSAAVNPYPLSLWYVEDPLESDVEPVIRFSRNGWMEGTVALDGVEAVVMLTESEMNGVFSIEDSWALASLDSAANTLAAGYARSLEEHSWLLQKAYRVTEVDPSGRRLFLAPFDSDITRAEEVEMNDHRDLKERFGKERFGVTGFPTMILLNSEGQEIRRAAGYVNVEDMTEFLKSEK